MKIYTVVHSINESMSPSTWTSYHLDKEAGLKEFNICKQSVGDDYSTILLEEFDTDSKETSTIECFEGNGDDLDEIEDDEQG